MSKPMHSDPQMAAFCPYCHPERAHDLALAEERLRAEAEDLRQFVEAEGWLYR